MHHLVFPRRLDVTRRAFPAPPRLPAVRFRLALVFSCLLRLYTKLSNRFLAEPAKLDLTGAGTA
jgi:hypothetical protein